MTAETPTPGEASPKRSGSRKLTISYNWFAGALISAFVVGVLITILAKGPSTTSAGSPTANDTGSPVQPTAAATPPPAPKTWVQVAHFAGRDKQKTIPFTVGSQWRVHLVNHGNSNFIVDATDPSNSTNSVNLANSIGNFDQVTQEYDAGTYYLDVEGDSWDITIENYQ